MRIPSLFAVLALCLALSAPGAASAESIINNVGDAVNNAGKAVGGAVDTTFDYLDDGALTTKVKTALLGESNIKSTNISVSSKDGVVTLSGAARSKAERALILETVRKVGGVKQINAANLVVKEDGAQSADEYASDAAITTEIKTRLAMASASYLTSIGVETRDGIVTITGTVKTSEQFVEIQRIAGSVKGVRGVKNHLEVRL